jgi:predicted dehydrogenase
MSHQLDRRDFVEKLGVGTAGAITAGYTATSSGYQANETVNVACIGTGGRCRRLMQSLPTIPGVKIVGVCDIWDEHLAKGRDLADARAFTTKRYQDVLKRSDVDAVVIGTPDHWHVPLTIAACDAGKDVYVEKPLTHDLSEGKAVIAAQNRNKRIVQVGMQQRSMPHIVKANEILRSGVLGKIHKVHLTWNRNTPRTRSRNINIDASGVDWKTFLGNAKDQPFDAYRFRQWRWFWDFGGGIFTDLMVHWIDVVHWLLDLDHPEYAASIGDWYMAEGIWETPDTVQTILRYPKQNVQVYFEGTFSNARNGSMVEFMGDNATLYIDRGRYEIHPERKKKIKYSELVLGTGLRGADFYARPDGETLHLANWISCIRSRKKPTAPAEAGVGTASAAHMANLALRGNKAVNWPG